MKSEQKLSRAQRLAKWLLPRSWSDSMEKESRQWIATCRCGNERSIWELGGIRWKAAGEPRKLLRCPSCGELTWHKVGWRGESGK
jgi:hypothetical protein